MNSQRIFVVFVLPIILSVTLATVVMADVLEKPDRNLQMWPPPPSSSGHGSTTSLPGSDVVILGLENSYAQGDAITLRVSVKDVSFDCGDLYITIRDAHDASVVVTQRAFFAQCFMADDLDLPTADEFAVMVDSPGSYVAVAEMRSGENSITTLGEFIVE